MTYPPQPPWQPPYGQQPGQGMPPSGQFPSGTPHGGQHPQYGHPQPPFGQPGGFGQTPKKSKTGLVVGVGVGALALVAFLVTGLVAPGFLLGDDEATSDDAAAAGAPPQPGGPSSAMVPTQAAPASDTDPTSVLTNFLEAVNTGDSTTAMGMVCEEVRSDIQATVDTVIASSGQFSPAGELLEQPTQDGTAYLLDLEGTSNNKPVTGLLAAAQFNDPPRLCVAGFSILDPEAWEQEAKAEKTQFLEKFHDALNSGDSNTLAGMMCSQPDEGAAEAVQEAVSLGGEFRMENTEVDAISGNTEFVNSNDDTLWIFVQGDPADPDAEGLCVLRAQIDYGD